MTTEPTQADLIDAIISAYHTTRLSDVPFAAHIASKQRVKDAFAAHREASTAALSKRVEELEVALREMVEVVCGETGFAQAVRADSGIAYPWPALDMAEAKAKAALGGDHA